MDTTMHVFVAISGSELLGLHDWISGKDSVRASAQIPKPDRVSICRQPSPCSSTRLMRVRCHSYSGFIREAMFSEG